MNLNRSRSLCEASVTQDSGRYFFSKDDLLEFLCLEAGKAPYGLLDTPLFPFKVPLSYAKRMRKNEWFDPLLLQVMPRALEETQKEGFVGDPVGDQAARTAPGVLYKYHARCLLMVSTACAMHCRFCFRREYSRLMVPHTSEEWSHAWEWIGRNSSINEIILSGGDPLCLKPLELEPILERVIAMPRIRTVRIHTRAPVADPESIDQARFSLIARLASYKTCIIVLHANHAAELSGDCSVCLTRLRASDALLLNQSVLLRGVNDTVEALADLSLTLVAHGVMPYYLHQLDQVSGAWHFKVDQDQGKSLINDVRMRLPGYAVPRYVQEKPGERSKLPL